MEIKIHMLNVEDGDAIIIELIKENDSLIMMIDGGEEKYYTEKVKPYLVGLLEKHSKKAPDIVVATHYDSDHIGGLIPLVKEFNEYIKEVWVNVPQSINNILLTENINESVERLPLDDLQKKSLPKMQESLKQLKSFVAEISEVKVKSTFAGKSFEGWPEIRVLGPSEEFHSELFKFRLNEYISDELQDINLYESFREPLSKIAYHKNDPCSLLKKDSDTKLSNTNLDSIIILITIDERKYLFTGDAGIKSFKKIPNWESELANIYFLKIPHHGSDNNISCEIINIMRPVYAYNSGNLYENGRVLECLAKKSPQNNKPRSTKNGNDLIFPSF